MAHLVPGCIDLQVDPSARLTVDDFQNTRAAALSAVRVPQHVIQLLADLRSYLQEKIEPPVYVSDRRLVKAVALMQVGLRQSWSQLEQLCVDAGGCDHVWANSCRIMHVLAALVEPMGPHFIEALDHHTSNSRPLL